MIILPDGLLEVADLLLDEAKGPGVPNQPTQIHKFIVNFFQNLHETYIYYIKYPLTQQNLL